MDRTLPHADHAQAARFPADSDNVALQVRSAVIRGTLDVAATLEQWPAISGELTHLKPTRALSAWLPFKQIVDIDDAILRHCGEAVVEDVHRLAANPTLQLPLFKPLIENAFRFFGRTPSALLRWAPAAIRMSLRGASEVMYQDVQGGCRLIMPNPHPEIRAAPSWRAGTRGSLKGIVEMVGYQGVVEDELNDDALIHRISWKRPR